MRNAKEEFLGMMKTYNKTKYDIKCANIYHGDNIWCFKEEKEVGTHTLPVRHSTHDAEVFIDSLDFGYYSGYGGQELFGVVWFKDGTWLERGEYDGSEWWEYKCTPEIPEGLQKKVKSPEDEIEERRRLD